MRISRFVQVLSIGGVNAPVAAVAEAVDRQILDRAGF
jgi:hypothetical protein